MICRCIFSSMMLSQNVWENDDYRKHTMLLHNVNNANKSVCLCVFLQNSERQRRRRRRRTGRKIATTEIPKMSQKQSHNLINTLIRAVSKLTKLCKQQQTLSKTILLSVLSIFRPRLWIMTKLKHKLKTFYILNNGKLVGWSFLAKVSKRERETRIHHLSFCLALSLTARHTHTHRKAERSERKTKDNCWIYVNDMHRSFYKRIPSFACDKHHCHRQYYHRSPSSIWFQRTNKRNAHSSDVSHQKHRISWPMNQPLEWHWFN